MSNFKNSNLLDSLRLNEDKTFQQSYSEKLSSELKGLQNKLKTLETRMNKRESPKIREEPSRKIIKKKPQDQKSETPRSEQSSQSQKKIIFQEAQVKKCEKELRSLEDSLRLSSSLNSNSSFKKSDYIKENAELMGLRKTNKILEKENSNLEKKLKTNYELLKKIKSLQDDLASLRVSFRRSENLRAKQSSTIKDLKKQVSRIKKRTKSEQPASPRKSKKIPVKTK